MKVKKVLNQTSQQKLVGKIFNKKNKNNKKKRTKTIKKKNAIINADYYRNANQ